MRITTAYRFLLAPLPFWLLALGSHAPSCPPPGPWPRATAALHAHRRDGALVRLRWNPALQPTHPPLWVQRSEDGIEWLDLEVVPHNSAGLFADTFSLAAYYRLRQQLPGHSTWYSTIVRVAAARWPSPLRAAANPTRHLVQVLGQDPTQPVDVLDSSGQLIVQVNGPTFSLDELGSGTRFILRQGERAAPLVVR